MIHFVTSRELLKEFSIKFPLRGIGRNCAQIPRNCTEVRGISGLAIAPKLTPLELVTLAFSEIFATFFN